MSCGDYGPTMAGDQALMKSLEALNLSEGEVKRLQEEVISLRAELAGLRRASGEERESEGQDLSVKELLRVNHMWDVEYREQEKAFEQYRIDSQRAQQENQAYIAKLKEEKDYLHHEISVLQHQLSKGSHADSQREIEALKRESAQKDHIIGNLKQKIRMLEEQVSRQGDLRKLRQLEEEAVLLKQQVTAYKEDFEAERRDKERLSEEKQSIALRYEAELTSLKLQLDRCRNELQHYSTEATRLAQQLRLKQQYEEDQFKRHLESRGYVSRGSNGLPPLDPFVEHDPPSFAAPTVIEPPKTNGSPTPLPRSKAPQRGNYLLARSSDSDDTTSVSAPSSIGRTSPSPTHFRKYSHESPSRRGNKHQQNEPAIRTNGHVDPMYPPGNYANGYVMQNGDVVSNGRRVEIDSESSNSASVDSEVFVGVVTNGHLAAKPNGPAPHRVNSDGQLNRMVEKPTVEAEGRKSSTARTSNIVKMPPVQSKGRHKCPRCARRFQHSADCEDHKARCIS